MMRNSSKKTIKIFPGLLLAALLCNLLLAQSPLIEVEASVDKSVITIGDRVTYTLKISREKGMRIREPGKGTNLGMFEIKDYVVHDSVTVKNRIVQQFDYVISVYDTGKFVIPPYPIAFLPSDTSTQHQFITSEPLEIYVESVVNDENAQLRDIRPPFGIPENYWRMALMIGSLVLGIVALAIAYWLYRRRKQDQSVLRKEILYPAHEIALEDLHKLLTTDLLQNLQYKMFYSELSDIVRRYIERRFFVQAMEETTTELLTSLKEEQIASENVNIVREILNPCDLVKFAKYVPVDSETESTVQLVRDFIERTKIEFEAVESSVETEAEKTI
jgi:hypothetical protein